MSPTELSHKFKLGFQSGYRQAPFFINRMFNVLLAFILLILGLPLFLIIGGVVFLSDGFPVFYSGPRLGQHKKLFMMYKFRTLMDGSDHLLQSEIWTPRHGRATRFGHFLRDTRLDELPQLYNILIGDMDFVGPRPVRRMIYQRQCKSIPGYDIRFKVKPGMIGYSQLFTPHAAPKRIRSFIDNRLISKKRFILGDFIIIAYTVLMVIRKSVQIMIRTIYDRIYRQGISRQYRQKRQVERVEPRRTWVRIQPSETHAKNGTILAEMIDLNDEAFLIRSDEKVNLSAPHQFVLLREIRRGRNRYRRKRAVCTGTVLRSAESKDGRYDYVIRFEAATRFNHYMLHQYFLNESVANF